MTQDGDVGEVLVTRDGSTTRYRVYEYGTGNCADDVIRPGDLVTVTVQQNPVAIPQEWVLSAGVGYGCPGG
jgi:hypothetical protein